MATAPNTECATWMGGSTQNAASTTTRSTHICTLPALKPLARATPTRKNRLQQTLKDWDRIAKQQRPPADSERWTDQAVRVDHRPRSSRPSMRWTLDSSSMARSNWSSPIWFSTRLNCVATSGLRSASRRAAASETALSSSAGTLR